MELRNMMKYKLKLQTLASHNTSLAVGIVREELRISNLEK
jgi:hypothetical protein